LHAEIDIIGSTQIVLSSKLDNLAAITTIINNLRSYHRGGCTGYLHLDSDTDISEALLKTDTVWE